jgi:hypothetical protein
MGVAVVQALVQVAAVVVVVAVSMAVAQQGPTAVSAAPAILA